MRQRQEEVQDFWKNADEDQIKPILDTYDEAARAILEKALYLREDEAGASGAEEASLPTVSMPANVNAASELNPTEKHKAGSEVDPNLIMEKTMHESTDLKFNGEEADGSQLEVVPITDQKANADDSKKPTPISEGIKKLRNAYIAAKRAYRIPPSRLQRVGEALSLYVGTHTYHNYTVQKSFSDPSAKRVIKSFIVNPDPILINGSEWLSLKVHGQSFMMHQIRKMVGMVALIVRCGCDPKRIVESYGRDRISIPKAPSLGLLLERPIFDSYNKRAKHDLGKDAIDFDKFRTEMDEFKQREIYDRMYRDEEKDNV